MLKNQQKINIAGLRILKSFESIRLNAYLDTGKVPTIGWGHTKGVKIGDVCTQAQADQWLLEDLAEAEGAVNRLISDKLTPNQFSALVVFVYNIGEGQFKSSTMLKRLRLKDYPGAAEQFPRWDKDNGIVVAGLTRRRAAEQALFLQA